jgi:hypothetical protein
MSDQEPVRYYDENGEPQDGLVLMTDEGPVWVPENGDDQ